MINVPADNPLPGTQTLLPYHLVADDAFPSKGYIMKPYSRKSLEDEKHIFNYRLSRARRIIGKWLVISQ